MDIVLIAGLWLDGSVWDGVVPALEALGHRPVPLPPGNGTTTGTFLVDGIWQGTWRIRDQTLHIQPFTKLRHADRNALLAEAVQLCAFVAPHAKYHIVLDEP